ncbi:hypothetical protein pb186bvf_012130 [Paramecium bursaria]
MNYLYLILSFEDDLLYNQSNLMHLAIIKQIAYYFYISQKNNQFVFG